MYQTILIPVSGKNGLSRTQTVLQSALPLARGSIMLVHIFEPISLIVGGQNHASLLADAKAKGQTLLHTIGVDLEKKGIPYRCRVEEGTVAETIVRVSHEENADLIAMYTDGRDGLQDMMLGSITERVLRNTDTTLLAVRH